MNNTILSFVEVQKNQINGVFGLNLPSSVTISADGEFVYVTGLDNQLTTAVNESAIAVFRRNETTGKLSFVEAQQGIDGLGSAYATVISPDGNYLYVAGFDNAAIALFRRDQLTGKLSFVNFSPDNALLSGFTAITISHDSKFLYATATNEDAVAVFARDPITGELNFIELQQDDIDDVDGLDTAYSLLISPDGKFLYVAGIDDAAIAVFERDLITGELRFVEVQKDYTDSIDELFIPYSLAISPDGKFLYGAGVNSAIAVFERDPTTGSLSLVELQEDVATDTEGLAGVNAIAISPDGKFLYVAIFPHDAVAVFRRDTSTGKLSFAEIQQDNTNSVDGLDGVFSLTTSPDSKFIYAAGLADSAIVVLSQHAQKPVIINIQDDIFTIKNSDTNTKAQLQFQVTKPSANIIYELGVFSVDDTQGNIRGIAPGATDYTRIALARGKVVLFSIANPPNGFNPLNLNRTLEFNAGENIRFYLIPNSTTHAILSGKTPFSEVVFLSNENIQVEDDGFSLNLSDLGVRFQAIQQESPLGISPQEKHQGELIDLRGVTQSLTGEFIVNREAAFDNFVGFYRVVDENGGIDNNGDGIADILVGQPGYIQAAVRGRVNELDLNVSNQGTATYTGIFEPGAMFAPFIIVNNRPDAVLDSNQNNEPAVYFPFLGANTDRVDHIHLLGNNTFGFEDLANGGDRDYNDVIVRVNLGFI